MTDLSKTIEPKSDQLNSDDLISGPITVKIIRVSACADSSMQPIAVNFEGDNNKPYKPCKSMRRVMVQIWGKDGTAYVGRAMTLYRDPTVQFGGMAVGGIRISHMSDIDKPVTMALTASRANRKPFTVKPLEHRQQDQSSGEDMDAAKAEAMKAASEGTAAFTEWWNSDGGKENRHLVKDIMPELKKLASDADASDDDPFAGQSTGEPEPTPEEMERAAQEAQGAIAAQDAEQEQAA